MSDVSSRRDRIEAEEAASDSGSLFAIVLGPTIWAVHFLVVYVGAAIACEQFPAFVAHIPTAVAVVTGVAIIAIVAVTVPSMREFAGEREASTDDDTQGGRKRFLAHAAMLLSALSVVAVIYGALPGFLSELCV